MDDLLDVNRISQGRIELKREQIDLREPIKNAIEAFNSAIESNAIEFNTTVPTAKFSRIRGLCANRADNVEYTSTML